MKGVAIMNKIKTSKIYGDVARDQEDRRKSEILKAAFYISLLLIVALLGCIFDYAVFIPILNSTIYDNDRATNLILAIVFSIIPILWACAMSFVLRKALNNEKRHAIHLVLAALLLAGFIAYVIGSSLLRAQLFEANKELAWLMNVVPVVIAILVLIIHIIIERSIEKHFVQASVYEGERNLSSLLEYLSRYLNISSIDRTRRDADFREYVDKGELLIKQIIDGMNNARRILAKLVAVNGEDVQAIINTPKHVDGIDRSSEAEAIEAIRQLIDAPAVTDQHLYFGAAINGPHVDQDVRETILGFEARHQAMLTEYADGLVKKSSTAQKGADHA